MRIDKYLKISRLIKRRTVAKDICDGGKVKINGVTAKAGSIVKNGDIIEIGFGSKEMKVQIVEIKESVRAEDAAKLYKIIN